MMFKLLHPHQAEYKDVLLQDNSYEILVWSLLLDRWHCLIVMLVPVAPRQTGPQGQTKNCDIFIHITREQIYLNYISKQLF